MSIRKKNIVISAINVFEGGPLSIMKDFLNALARKELLSLYEITVFVHKKELYSEYTKQFTFLEKPSSRKSYLFRLYYEYIYFFVYSITRKIDIWISMHDMTPTVKAKDRYVYCHNASPFLRPSSTIWRTNKTLFFMSLLYKYVYRVNIRKNSAVIVQQDWMRREFYRMFGVKRIIVARPTINTQFIPALKKSVDNRRKIFFYPLYPRPFKNIELICEACKILESRRYEFEMWLTLDGTENRYTKDVYGKYANITSLKWLGLISREGIMRLYGESDCLVFPSLLESWGLPITEYKAYGKPMLCSDLPYAHEAVDEYHAVSFFDPYNAEELAEKMAKLITGRLTFDVTYKVNIASPYVSGWEELVSMICRPSSSMKFTTLEGL